MNKEKGSIIIEAPVQAALKVLVLFITILAFIGLISKIMPGCSRKYGDDFYACNADRNCRPVTKEPGAKSRVGDYFLNQFTTGVPTMGLSGISAALGGPSPIKISAHSIGCEPCVHPPCRNFTAGRTIEVQGISVTCECPDSLGDGTERLEGGNCLVKKKADIMGFDFWGLGDYTQKDGRAVCNYKP